MTNPTPQAPALTALTKEDEELVVDFITFIQKGWFDNPRQEHFLAVVAKLEDLQRKANLNIILRRRLADRDAVIEACKRFKQSFDKGFPNSLSAVNARDEIFEALAALDRGQK